MTYILPRQHSSAFTVVELLVVIAIISILAALLMPALQQAVESARQVVCSNNEKQIGFAVLEYAEEHKGAPPGPNPYPRYKAKLYNKGYLDDMLNAWSNNPHKNGIFGCPSEQDPGGWDRNSEHGYRGSHYGGVENPKHEMLRPTLWNPSKPNWGTYQPGKGAIIGEANASSLPHNFRNSWWHVHESFKAIGDLDSWFHNGGWDLWRHPNANIGVWFADGHVKRISEYEKGTFP